MGELTVSQLIKIILGILVVVAVVFAVYLIIKDYVIDFFKNMGGGDAIGGVIALLK